MALRVVQNSALAGCLIPSTIIQLYSELKAPFKNRHDRALAKSVCDTILKLANVSIDHLKLTDKYVFAAIVLARYKTLTARPPPRYTPVQMPYASSRPVANPNENPVSPVATSAFPNVSVG